MIDEIENLEPEIEASPEVEFVDTSGADYLKSFTGEQSVNDDYPTAETESQEEPQEQESIGEIEMPDNSESTGNIYVDALRDFAESKNMQINMEHIDLENFSEEDMERAVGQYYADKYYDNVDPRLKHLANTGINMDQYLMQQNQLSSLINTDINTLSKGYLYEQLYNQEAQLGTLKADENGNLSEDSQKWLIEQVELRAQQMGDERLNAIGNQLQEHYKSQLNQLPNAIQQQQQAMYAQQVHNYNQEVAQLTEAYRDALSKTQNFIADFSGQSEKDDFLNYVQSELSSYEHEGNYVIPFMDKIQNDGNFLLEVMRLKYLSDNGYFTDIKNAERNASFKKLSVVPTVGKGSIKKGSKSNNRFVDTSTAEYLEQFKK